MKAPAIPLTLLLSALWIGSASAAPVESADEVCAPSADPCIISTPVEVSSEFPLDFGLRTVRVTGTGQLVGTLDLRCGAFETLTTGTWMDVVWQDVAGPVTITAYRACSLNPALACLSDTVCSDASAGLCTLGDGGIRVTGKLSSISYGITLRAAGDIALEGAIHSPGGVGFADGGQIHVESSFGSIESAAEIDVHSVANDGYYGGLGLGGSVLLRAAQDVTLRNQIIATGGWAAIEVDAGRDINVLSAILAQGRQGDDHVGGTIDLAAIRDLRIVRETGLVAPLLNITGGTEEYSGGYGYGYTSGGPGGYGFIFAGRDLVVGEKVRLIGDSGMSVGAADTTPLSGDWYFEAGEDLSFDAQLSARAWGRYGYALHGVSLYGDQSVRMGRRATIATNGRRAGTVALVSYDGSVSMEGRVNVRGRKIRYYGYTQGYGGRVRVRGEDVTIKGKVQNGGPSSAGEMSVTACRLRMPAGGRLDSGWGKQYDGPYGTNFYIGESMKTYGGSGIRGKEGAQHRVEYRDAAKPPVFGGTITPLPTLVVNPLLPGCPVCGNLEVDQGETCDDGNAADGDGCDSDCLLEP